MRLLLSFSRGGKDDKIVRRYDIKVYFVLCKYLFHNVLLNC